MTTATRCADVADAADDPREGTAPPAERWFLVEHPGPWGRVALAQSGIVPGAVAALSAWALAENGRVLLVRRHSRRTGAAKRRWFRVDSRPGHEEIRTGTFTDEADLVAAVRAAGDPFDGPLYLVCTHGRHDTCCAVRGRPAAAAVAAAAPERTWECSHIGGCRFAPALVLLPHGFTLGGVPPECVPAVVRDYAEGRLEPRWARGRSVHSPAVQAAQQYARVVTGATAVDALEPVSVEPDGAAWVVRFRDPDVTVRLRERRVEAGRPLTCTATAPGWLRVFDLVDVEPSPTGRP
ncbi:sucrase ferredoxin [Pseudonocardia sp.]|uniref:sucrase ferredoxin n=1 Tax=Pseudonocardia sp. TaxID=60912 RepID=UPI0026317453|nr:sucrase ferredoxin [Pseudonocardia sp.]MCW2722104.1 hypothetical protein [Pseudonocardia sp.]